MSLTKEGFRDFMKAVLPTDGSTLFKWSTWDTDNADVVVTETLVVARRANVNRRPWVASQYVFDANFAMHCPIACVSDQDM